MGIYAPHPPLNPPKDILARYDGVEIPQPHWDENEYADKPEPLKRVLQNQLAGKSMEDILEWRKYFYAMCTMLDEQVGRVMKCLEERGELDDTLIVFQSDHGDMASDHRELSKGNHAFYPECMRIPLIFHWPKGIPGGKQVGGLVEAIDILPTMLDLCGLPYPDVLQGQSLAEGLRAGNARGDRDDVLTLDGPPEGPLMGLLRSKKFQYVTYGPGREVLYDLEKDPKQYVNRVADAAYAPALHEMRERMLNRCLRASASVVPKYHCF